MNSEACKELIHANIMKCLEADVNTRSFEIPISKENFEEIFQHKIPTYTSTKKQRRHRDSHQEQQHYHSSNIIYNLFIPKCSLLTDVFGDGWWLSFWREQVAYVSCRQKEINIRLVEHVVTSFQTKLVIGEGEFETIPETVKKYHWHALVMTFAVASRTRWGSGGIDDDIEWRIEMEKASNPEK